MTKRYDYNGGLIATNTAGQQGGIYSLARQLQLEQTNNWDYDTNFSNVSLLINAESSTVTQLFSQDNSGNNINLSISGDPRPVLNSPFDGNQYSVYFNGSTDFLSFAGSSNFAVTTSTTPFTIEAWVMPMGNTGCIFSEQWTGSVNISIVISMADGVSMDTGTVGQTVCFGWYNGSSWVTAAGANQPLALGVWTHVACVFTGSTTRIYYNGVDVTKPSNPTPASSWGITGINGDSWYIGRRWDATGSAYFNGFIKDFRFVKGTAVYTGNFTPPTAPLSSVSGTSILTCQSNRFRDNSSNAVTIANNGTSQVATLIPFTNYTRSALGSVYFDGSGDNLSWAGTTVGTNPYTFECWFYNSGSFSNIPLLGSSNVGGLNIRFAGTGTIQVDSYNTSNSQFTVPVIYLNTWNHIAVTRNASNQTTVFLNGVRSSNGAVTVATNYSAATNTIASQAGLSNYIGFLRDVRFIVGSAVYDPTQATITIPTASLPAVTNTRILTLQNNNAVNNSAYFDRGPHGVIISKNGNTTLGSFNPYASGWSVFFGQAVSSGSNLLAAYLPNFVLNSDFTIECWIYPTATGGMIVNFAGGLNIAWASYELVWDGTFVNFAASSANTGYDIGSETGATGRIGAPTLNAWNHIAVTRSGNIYRGFLNGVQGYTQTLALTPYNPGARGLAIGSNYANTWGSTPANTIAGWMADLRIIKGTAIYTTNFTPPKSSLTAVPNTVLLTCQSNRYIDNSGNNSAITQNGTTVAVQKFSPYISNNQTYNTSLYSGSYYFDGASDYISAAVTPATAFRSNNFTIELWAYFTNSAAASHQGIYGNYNTWGANSFYFGKHTNSGTVSLYINNISATVAVLAESTQPPNNAWTHYALVRNGTSVILYRNGAVSASATVSAGMSFTGASNVIFIGALGDILSTSSFPGYFCDFRISNYPVYVSAFTPPTKPLTPNSGTMFMLGNRTAIVDYAMISNFETAGDARVSTVIKRVGSASLSFDGSTDWLFTPGNRIFNFGSGNWTVEAWVYLNAMPTSDAWPTNYSLHFVLTCTGTAGAGDGFDCIIGQTKLMIQSNDVRYEGTAHGMVINTWYHVAYVRNGNTIFFYVNGVARGSVAFTGSVGTGANTWIGCETGEGAFFNGYVDDLRVSRFARYTSAFTSPTRLPLR